MKINGIGNLLKHYHIGNDVFNALCEEGLPYQIGEKRNQSGPCRVFDTDIVDAWLKEQGINLAERAGRKSAANKYITVEQAKNLFPQNPAMALLYAIFCTREEYLKMFRI